MSSCQMTYVIPRHPASNLPPPHTRPRSHPAPRSGPLSSPWPPRQGKLKANETPDRTGTIHPAGVSAPVFASGRKRLTMARSSFELNGLER